MRWLGRRQSDNVEDRRGMGMGGGLIGGGLAAIVGFIIYLMGGDPGTLLQEQEQPRMQTQSSAQDDSSKMFVSTVLADTEDVWHKLFSSIGKNYEEPVLILFDGHTTSGCGNASSATGPFYCPSDEKLYIDLSFYRELRTRFNAPGDFAMAYVVAHEVGHHIQHLLGIEQKVRRMQQQTDEAGANALSVKLELQADFFAGVWAHHAEKLSSILERGDIEEALGAANAVGDDRLQQEGQGYVVPESFTHGTSQQRMYWFKKGFDSGDLSQGDTFSDIR